MTLGSISRRAWMAALVAVVAASVAMSATAVAGAGKEKPETPEVTAITVSPIHEAQVVRGDDGKDHVEYDLLVVSVVGDPVTLSMMSSRCTAKRRAFATAPPVSDPDGTTPFNALA